ncbi:hypothetical protein GY45DRAFT_1321377 [Cubamyces sp. BRFM 1775]|nr:hypothetical protein GY45DRAFT_1321377 [Cubamyces sp. BRFM 1775]
MRGSPQRAVHQCTGHDRRASGREREGRIRPQAGASRKLVARPGLARLLSLSMSSKEGEASARHGMAWPKMPRVLVRISSPEGNVTLRLGIPTHKDGRKPQRLRAQSLPLHPRSSPPGCQPEARCCQCDRPRQTETQCLPCAVCPDGAACAAAAAAAAPTVSLESPGASAPSRPSALALLRRVRSPIWPRCPCGNFSIPMTARVLVIPSVSYARAESICHHTANAPLRVADSPGTRTMAIAHRARRDRRRPRVGTPSCAHDNHDRVR